MTVTVQQSLIASLDELNQYIPNIPLVPINYNKQPQGLDWGNNPFTTLDLKQKLENKSIVLKYEERDEDRKKTGRILEKNFYNQIKGFLELF